MQTATTETPRTATRTALLVAITLAMTSMVITPGTAQDGAASVTIEDQTSGGTTITVAEAALPDGGFIAIHDQSLQDDEVLGSVVGASGFLPAGSHSDIEIRLSEPLREHATLIAMAHQDSDDNRVYSFLSSTGGTDGPYTSGDMLVTDTAEINVTASIGFQDQDTGGSTVFVDHVELARGGFVAIHDDTLLAGDAVGSVVGHSEFLSEGEHRHITVELDEELNGTTTLIAMPHVDSNGDETYDFVTSEGGDDGPYTTAAGDAVTAQASVTVSDTATVSFAAQSSGGHLVAVDSAFLPDGGFVTIHDEGLLDGDAVGSVVGVSDHLAAGLHKHLSVQLDSPLDDNQSLTAMPHRDTNGNQNYDFVTSEGGEDGPYTAGGGAVVETVDIHYSASVHGHNQTADGRSIKIAYADLSSDGFVTLHDASLFGGAALESVVGQTDRLRAGIHRNLTIELDEPLLDTQLLVAMPHKDSDGDGTYDFVTSNGTDDGPFTDANGDAVVDPFHVTMPAVVTFEEQTSTDGTVVVHNVTMTNGGFVTIHDDSLLDGDALGSVVGVSKKLSPGSYAEVNISTDLSEPGTYQLIAMPHKDSNDNDAYDFVDSEGAEDGPYLAHGGAIVHSAPVTIPSDEEEDGDDGQQARGPDDGERGGDADDDAGTTPGPTTVALVALVVGLLAVARCGRRD